MAASTERIFCITIKKNDPADGRIDKVLVSKKIMKCDTQDTFKIIMDQCLATQYEDIDSPTEVTVSRSATALEPMSVDINEHLLTALTFDENIRFITFHIKPTNVPAPTETPVILPNAFDILQVSSSGITRQRPELKSDQSLKFTAKDRLFNRVVEEFITSGALFPSSMLKKDVEKRVMVITNALWYMDGNQQKIMERAHHLDEVQPIPKRLLSSKFTSSWGELRIDLELFALSLDSYSVHLESKCDDQRKRHALYHAVRELSEHAWLEVIEASETPDARYSLLDNSLTQLNCFEPLLFDESIHVATPFNSFMQRYRFTEEIALSVPVCMLSYHPGGSSGKVVYYWRVDDTSTKEMMTLSMQTYERLRQYLPEYHTRQMRRDFIQRYCKLGSGPAIPKHILRAIYADLTLDMAASHNPSLDARVQTALIGEDPDLVLDLRHINPGRPNDTFNTFFEVLRRKVEDMQAVDERRQGSVCHFAKYISVPDLIADVSKDLPEGSGPVPSESTVLLSFVPKNSHANTAKLYTSKVPLQFKVQTRQLRVSHIDEHYCSAIFRYCREYAVSFQNEVMLLCIDDKCKVDFGEPFLAVQSGVRGKKAIIPSTSTLSALDHDVSSKGSLTPSVCLRVDIPDDISDTFYRGDVSVIYKDSVFEASTPFRHAVELNSILAANVEIKPVLMLYSDGGPDHRVTYHSVKIALILLFKELNLDLLIAARTAPGHSWLNPAERVMSILNLAIQNTALSRSECNSHYERVLKSTNGMSDIRTKANKVDGLREAWVESVKPVKELLEQRTRRLSLKNKPFSVHDAAPQNAIEEYQKRVLAFNIEIGKYQQQHLESKAAYKEYLKVHCKEEHYTFQVRKCSDPECCPPRVSANAFPWLPDPVPRQDDNAHYKCFQDVVNTETTGGHRPSAQIDSTKTVAEKLQGVKSQGMVAQNVRKVVLCFECGKPRCVYSKRSLTLRDSRSFQRLMEKHDYSCGSMITPEGDALESVLAVRLNIDCRTHVEFAYYASSLGRQDVCAHCASEGISKDEALGRCFRVVLPVCERCLQRKLDIPHRNPVK